MDEHIPTDRGIFLVFGEKIGFTGASHVGLYFLQRTQIFITIQLMRAIVDSA
jgi:hypothetical protein